MSQTSFVSRPISTHSRFVLLTICLIALLFGQTVQAQGIVIPHSGPVNRAFGGASTAAPIDAIGAIRWNPATTSGLPTSELSFGMGLILADASFSSTAGGGGVTSSESGLVPVPNIAWVHHSETNPRITYGVGLMAVAGLKMNYPNNSAHPLQVAVAGGPIYAEAQFLQLAPTMSIALNDQLSVGFGPTLTMGTLWINPQIFSAGPPFPSTRGTRTQMGGGAQAGVYYIANNDWHFGASVKTPQWMEEFRWSTSTGIVARKKFDLPMIVSAGAAYNGLQNWVLACDLRYLNYDAADGFGDAQGVGAAGVTGLGWSSVMSVNLGAQYQWSERLTLRSGYNYNQNPIQSAEVATNIPSPLFYQHTINMGGSIHINQFASVNFAYSWLIPEQMTGPNTFTGMGTVTSKTEIHILSFGVTVRY